MEVAPEVEEDCVCTFLAALLRRPRVSVADDAAGAGVAVLVAVADDGAGAGVPVAVAVAVDAASPVPMAAMAALPVAPPCE